MLRNSSVSFKPETLRQVYSGMKEKILIIDDDRKLLELLIAFFEKYGYLATAIDDPLVAIGTIEKIKPDIIILDVMMPGMDGFECCRQIRRNFTLPVIMLSARGEATDKIVGLELGADDYLAKPFEPRELLARIQAVLRRNSPRATASGLALNSRKNSVSLNGDEIGLTTLEFYILKYLSENRDYIVSREMIFEKIKGMESDSLDRSVDVLISRLRSKLGDDPKDPKIIRTVHGRGYMCIM